ncbi:S1/P1 nuclease-domain-containing protein [Polychytrium aggregatum]|uniref:S1/P1 nuclease-domain-containing protein n=1 Tax=Polychytrium aggregatum TaxID=110093 RepID=UPI0022FEA90F|nr:S1/P1 nuclease-domain-containing protein [Polychytrium aggregatum]KAI9207664.1 S1/P1 nuclease-domain-containing protein [Polychytrium aggregatum]
MFKLTSVCTAAVALVLAADGVAAWGATGHMLVGNVAQSFLSQNSINVINQLQLLASYGNTLEASVPASSVCNWADQVKYTAGYTWSAPLHFVDTVDNPPVSCSFNYARDCPGGNCVVGAIANYTSRLNCNNNYGQSAQVEALQFLTHFLGDITQPLHACGRDLGGNNIPVVFDGVKTNLHHIWDTEIPEKIMAEDYGNSYTTFANALISKIQNDYASQTASWVACTDLSSNACPSAWAADSNSFDCSTVFNAEATSGDDLGGDYFNNVKSIVDLQLAKAGYRLAMWLNNVLGTCSSGGSSTSAVVSTSAAVSTTTTSATTTAAASTTTPVVITTTKKTTTKQTTTKQTTTKQTTTKQTSTKQTTTPSAIPTGLPTAGQPCSVGGQFSCGSANDILICVDTWIVLGTCASGLSCDPASFTCRN